MFIASIPHIWSETTIAKRDEEFQREYAASAKDPDAWAAFRAKYIDCGDHAEYRRVVGL